MAWLAPALPHTSRTGASCDCCTMCCCVAGQPKLLATQACQRQATPKTGAGQRKYPTPTTGQALSHLPRRSIDFLPQYLTSDFFLSLYPTHPHCLLTPAPPRPDPASHPTLDGHIALFAPYNPPPSSRQWRQRRRATRRARTTGRPSWASPSRPPPNLATLPPPRMAPPPLPTRTKSLPPAA